ncbi:MAG: hypothetical protein QOD06_1772 [Candidatus Binatota bacterium]|nr:hypothetical protein [Candidatus Binatota bacterium]
MATRTAKTPSKQSKKAPAKPKTAAAKTATRNWVAGYDPKQGSKPRGGKTAKRGTRTLTEM